MSKNRIKIPAAAPVDRRQMEILAGKIAEWKNTERELKAYMDAELNTVRVKFSPFLTQAGEKIAVGMEQARAWAEANPAEFGKGRSIEMTSAVVGYRTGQPQLKTLAGWTWDRVLEKLKTVYPFFVRTKEEVDKAAILAAREQCELGAMGVRVVQEETFYVEPKITETVARETINIDNLPA